DATVAENVIGFGRGGAVGAFDDGVSLNVRSDFFGDRAFHRGGNQHFAVADQQFFVGGRIAAGEIGQHAVFFVIGPGGIDIDSIFVVDTAFLGRNGDDDRAASRKKAGGVKANVAESLHGDLHPVELLVLRRQIFPQHVHDPAARRLFAADASAQ